MNIEVAERGIDSKRDEAHEYAVCRQCSDPAFRRSGAIFNRFSHYVVSKRIAVTLFVGPFSICLDPVFFEQPDSPGDAAFISRAFAMCQQAIDSGGQADGAVPVARRSYRQPIRAYVG
jgi:hypothetical protein